MDRGLWSVELGEGMGVMQLGASRDEVLSRLAAAGIELDADDDEPEWLYVDELDAELAFKAEPPHVLREIVVEDERLRFGPLPVIGERLHAVVDLLRVQDSETLWRTVTASFPGEAPIHEPGDPSAAPSANELLRLGTLWIPSLGLGLGMFRGEITTVRLRKPADAPRDGIGPLTPAQRELSGRPDLPDHLLGSTSVRAPRAGSLIAQLLTLIMFAAMGLIIWRAVDYQRRWNAAPLVEGEVLDVKPPPPEPFPDWFTIAYHDEKGRAYQTVLRRSDVYAPHKVGDKVELRFLPEAPDRPLGPARVRDAAFETYLPWGIGIMVAFVALQAMVPLAEWAMQRRRTATKTE